MATRSIQTGEDVESALAFLAKQNDTTGDKLFLDAVAEVLTAKLAEADATRFDLSQKIMASSDSSSDKIKQLKDLLSL